MPKKTSCSLPILDLFTYFWLVGLTLSVAGCIVQMDWNMHYSNKFHLTVTD